MENFENKLKEIAHLTTFILISFFKSLTLSVFQKYLCKNLIIS